MWARPLSDNEDGLALVSLSVFDYLPSFPVSTLNL